LFAILFFVTQLDAQHLPDSFFSTEFGIGPRMIQTEGGNYQLDFSDQSGKAYSFSKEINDPFVVVGLNFALSWGSYAGFTHSLYTDFPASQNGSGKFGYAIGYNFPIEVGVYDVLIEPSVGYTQGKTRFKFAEISVDSTGLNFFGRDYASEVINLKLTQRSRYVNTMLKFTFLKRQERAFGLEIGYDFEIQDRGEFISFDGSQTGPILLPYDNSFINLSRDNNPVKQKFFQPGGLRITLIYGFYKSKDKFD